MKSKNIYTISSETDIWKQILYYSYSDKIREYLGNTFEQLIENTLTESISGSILQAKEYFDAAKSASLQIKPLLLYYGTTNIMIAFAKLKMKKQLEINEHGMRIIKDEEINFKNIEATKIKTLNPTTGMLSVLSYIYGFQRNICDTEFWTIRELIASIPDLYNDYKKCFPLEASFLIPIEEIDDIQADYDMVEISEIEKSNDYSSIFENVYKFNEVYFTPIRNSENLILNRKITYKDYSIQSLSGQKFLIILHKKKGVRIHLPLEINILMILFSLGYLCRYMPELWNPFVRSDSSGKKLLIEAFLDYVERKIPNLVLDYITDQKNIFINK